VLAELLIEAFNERDYASARFTPYDQLQRNLLAVHDALVHGSYIAFRSIALTDWWLALWSLTERHSLTHVAAPLAALELRDAGAWTRARIALMHGDCIASQADIMPALADAAAVMTRFAAGDGGETDTLQELREIEAPLIPLGFSLEGFRELSTRHGFSRPAQRLLGREHALTAAVEVIDQHAGLPLRLRLSTFVNAVIRLLALSCARTSEVSIAALELAPAVLGAIEKLAIPGADATLWRTLVGHLRSLSLRTIDATAAQRTSEAPHWRVILECNAHGRHVCVRVKRADAAAECDELELDTQAGGERLIVHVTGHAPPADLLADLA
jgi:hypothetical protein